MYKKALSVFEPRAQSALSAQRTPGVSLCLPASVV